MAGIKAGFISGANAKITINATTIAYCQDVSYTVDVANIPVESMGTYEVHSYEPVAYTINGSFSVTRYTKAGITAAKDENGPQKNGNAPDLLISEGTNTLGMHLDPARMLQSSSFDLSVYEKRESDADSNSIYTISNCRIVRRSATLNKRGVLVDNYQFVGIIGTDTDKGIVQATQSSFV